MPLSKPAEYGEGISNRFRSWLISTVNRLFYMQRYGVSISIPSISANSTTTVSLTTEGIRTDDVGLVLNITDSVPDGVGIGNIRATASNTVEVSFFNVKGTSSTATTVSGNLLVFKRE